MSTIISEVSLRVKAFSEVQLWFVWLHKSGVLDLDTLAFIARYEAKLRENKIPKMRLYEECGFSDAAVSQWRKGKTVPSTRSIQKIADFLNVSYEYLAGGNEQEERHTSEDEFDTLAIIKRIEMRLAEVGLSKSEFYEKSGITSASYSQWNTGKFNPTPKKLRAAAECLGVSYEYLVTGTEQKETPTPDGGRELPHAKYREVLAEGGVRLLLDADAKVTQEQLDDIVEFIKFKQRKNGR